MADTFKVIAERKKSSGDWFPNTSSRNTKALLAFLKCSQIINLRAKVGFFLKILELVFNYIL